MTQPQKTFPYTIETSWHGLMREMAVHNVTKAQGSKYALRAVAQLMKRH